MTATADHHEGLPFPQLVQSGTPVHPIEVSIEGKGIVGDGQRAIGGSAGLLAVLIIPIAPPLAASLFRTPLSCV